MDFSFKREKGSPPPSPKPSPISFQPIERNPRSDKRIRSTLKLHPLHDDKIRAICYNQRESKQKVMDRILHLVLDNDEMRDRLLASFPKGSQRHPYLILRD